MFDRIRIETRLLQEVGFLLELVLHPIDDRSALKKPYYHFAKNKLALK